MKILHAITGMRTAAGTTTFVKGVVEALARAGHEVTLATLAGVDGPDESRPCGDSVKATTIGEVLAGGETFDVVHLHGLWELPVVRLAKWAAKRDIAIVWSPHGAMSPWAMHHKRWKKLPFYHLFMKAALKRTKVFHATCAKEREWIRKLGFTQKIVEAPLGVSSCASEPTPERTENAVLFVGRLYPVKGLVNLVEAWALIDEGLRNAWKLRIVGPDQAGHRAELEALVKKLALERSVEFAGPEYGDDLEREYRKCAFLVLPSFTENFGGVVLDALAHGKPCIASIYTPWQKLQTSGCGWWTDNTPDALAEALAAMMRKPAAAREEMGAAGRRLAETEYSWDAIASRLYSAL